MSRSRHKHYSFGIGTTEMAVVDAASMHTQALLHLAEYLPGASAPATADWAPAIEAVLSQARLANGGRLSLTVADTWARYFMLNVPDGVGSLAELQALAAGRFESLFGATPDGWTLKADWQASGQTLICALPARLLDVAATVSAGSTWRIDSILPHALRLLRSNASQLPAECWLCSYTARSMLAMLIQQDAIVHVRQLPYAASPTSGELAGLLEAECLRAGCVMPSAIYVQGIIPALPADRHISSMQLHVMHAPKSLIARQGEVPEATAIAIQGALT